VRGGHLFIDEHPVPIELQGDQWYERDGDHLHPIDLSMGGGPDFGPVTVPADSYLVLGDNRGNSKDGRFFGWVARSSILGRAQGIIWRDGGPTWRKL
jgi:signal peptidase I